MGVAGLLGSQVAWEEFDPGLLSLLSRPWKLEANLRSLDAAGIAGICALTDGGGHESPATEDALLACFQHCVLQAAHRLQAAPAGETVCFVMDWDEPLASAALWHLEHLLHFAPPAARDRLGALGFESAQTFRPLQWAQWLARRALDLFPAARPPGGPPLLPGLDLSVLDPSRFVAQPAKAT
jgi:hypothetical protein